METKQHAVIYARVSSVAQLKKGDGLASQESRCREYARYKGYEVLEVFSDNKSGGDADRPAMIALLAYLKAQKETCVVIIDDINRFARDVVGALFTSVYMVPTEMPNSSRPQSSQDSEFQSISTHGLLVF
ncbi:recombinase family protein [Octadecabacter ascidiaceicola]|uniref:Resolvase/invertase-type recombinase catalytic domain-containing protein n=1 Tax=Octadecabacter ascidiaceicola TaxID=1655543 RepID=A0A238JRT4_9RHOB|nr:recombinase family protein [Octadecabacter ascidiaceicola]SMX32904.1 hypothetical protein OCA8868_00841 [Octadecabacter ascidiaceicola]